MFCGYWRGAIRDVLAKYDASNPRLCGSIAQGTAGPDSDVDLLLDLSAEGRSWQDSIARLDKVV
jgi:predicted nucleotidyltransferase